MRTMTLRLMIHRLRRCEVQKDDGSSDQGATVTRLTHRVISPLLHFIHRQRLTRPQPRVSTKLRRCRHGFGPDRQAADPVITTILLAPTRRHRRTGSADMNKRTDRRRRRRRRLETRRRRRRRDGLLSYPLPLILHSHLIPLTIIHPQKTQTSKQTQRSKQARDGEASRRA